MRNGSVSSMQNIGNLNTAIVNMDNQTIESQVSNKRYQSHMNLATGSELRRFAGGGTNSGNGMY